MSGDPKILDHNYDGIQEYDNPTPAWWHIIFLVTILAAPVYIVYFHMNPDVPNLQQRHEMAVAAVNKRLFAKLGRELKPDAESMQWLMHADGGKWMAVGKSMFEANCVSCHGRQGEGGVGPNMTDHAYKNIRKLDDIPRIIGDGAANGAMPAWRNRLSPNEIVLIGSYVAALRGRDVPGKAPEGETPPPWPTATN